MEFIGAWARADSEKQMRIMNCTFDDVRAGNHSFPRGFNTAATEIGRWIVTHADTAEAEASSLVIVADARTRGIPWREIRAHFRALRIGPRQGNALSLFRHLATAFDDYCRMFPETTQLARMAGIQNLMDAILPENQP